jgi:formylglycine-generating enzyme required for sulfatase activity
MGSPETDAERSPEDDPWHQEELRESFAIGLKEVTVREFLRFRPDFPYEQKSSPRADGPIINVSFFEATAYCNWLSAREGIPEDQWCYPKGFGPGSPLPAGYWARAGYRLPTEAEWEYAARSGAVTSRFYGTAEEMLRHYAWYTANSDGHAWPVGQLKPNDLGLFDVYGNAWEWCHRGEGAPGEEERLRGGSFDNLPLDVRSAFRLRNLPTNRPRTFGLRVARGLGLGT